MWKDVYEEFSELTKSEQMTLFEAMKQDLFPEEPDKYQIHKSYKPIKNRLASCHTEIASGIIDRSFNHLFLVANPIINISNPIIRTTIIVKNVIPKPPLIFYFYKLFRYYFPISLLLF